MKKYSEITLNEEEKKILEWFKGQLFTHVGRTTQYGFVEVFDENNDIRCNLKPMRKPFEFIEKGERYEIEKLLNPPQDKTVWDLKEGDEFWWLSSSGFIYKNRWKINPSNIGCRDQGNVFLTEEEAKFEARRREVYVKVKKWGKQVQEDMRIKIAEYCDNDVLATEEAYANLTNDIMKEKKH